MSIQECALYGELVLHLRDRAVELMAGHDGDVEAAQDQLDAIIRDWFFAPQDELYGCAPRELIWAERGEEPNPINPEYLDDFFCDDCPICQFEADRLHGALEKGEDHGWSWHYDDGGFPLIARYDAEGWDACFDDFPFTDDAYDDWEQPGVAPSIEPAADGYTPFPVETRGTSPEEFLARLRQPWLDPMLHGTADALADRLECSVTGPRGIEYRAVTREEILSLLVGLYEQGVEVDLLLAQMERFPYQKIALDWLARPDEHAALIVEAMEEPTLAGAEADLNRSRHHRDFVFALASIVGPGARLWLQGWLDAVAHGSFLRESRA